MNTVQNKQPLCDLIMKGGITSGIIYPRLVATLAKVYCFKNIGGTSAGAIAAAATAAAEYGRLHDKPDAFDSLRALPELLSKHAVGSQRSVLFNRFQPSSALKHHFAVLVGTLNAPNKIRLALSFLSGLLRHFLGAALLGMLPGAITLLAIVMGSTQVSWTLGLLLAVGAFLAWGGTLFLAIWVFRRSGSITTAAIVWGILGLLAVAALLAANATTLVLANLILSAAASGLAVTAIIATAVAVALFWFTVTFGKALPPNNFGICTGMPPGKAAGQPDALTPWMHDYFNSLAGRPTASVPLTFGDLWGCNEPDSRPEDKQAATRNADLRAVNLEMMTTAVSQGLPFRLPFKEDVGKTYLFDPREWELLFPPLVYQTIMDGSKESKALHPETKQALRLLPTPADFPVVVAVRMSLSFPILLCAIPLYSIDWSLQSNQSGTPTASRVWFSDGGISSNLPLHFFDSKLPSHPTFAVNLKPFHPDFQPQPGEESGFETGRVYLPRRNQDGRLVPHWNAQDKKGGIRQVIDFLLTIVETMQNWRDQIQIPYPGYRDRIVQISQKPTEGGLNLDMPAADVVALGNAGENAAQHLINRFAPNPANPGDAPGWTNHRAVRLRTFLGRMEELVLEVKDPESWIDLLKDLPCYQFDKKNKPEQHEELGEYLLNHLKEAAETVHDAKQTQGVSLNDEKAPHPTPALRISPQI